MALCHMQRTVQWGNWGIDFLAVQPDPCKNFGILYAHAAFPLGTRGPCMTHLPKWTEICRWWIETGELPSDAIRLKSL